MSEPEMNMPLPPHPPSPALSPSTPPIQLNPTTPEIYTRYTSKLVQRMQADTCYQCHQKGHWSWDCPLNSPNTKSPSPSPSPNHDSLSPIKIWCRCGHGYCEVKTAKNDRNQGRKYYACPIKRGRRCKEFVKWCDDPINDSYLQPPLFKYPECECGAGVCRKVKGTQSPVKYYFACPVGEGHGSCGYQVWEEQLLDNKSIVPIQESSERTLLDFWKDDQNKRTDNRGDDLLVVHSKRMRIMDKYKNPSSMALSELAEREDAAPKTAPSKGVGFPEFEVSEDLQYPDLSWDATEDEAWLLSRQSTPSGIYCRQNVFQMHIFAGAVADASFGHCPMGWLGHLLFFNPTQSLKFPPPQPFFCCIFPSFNSIVVPKQATIRDVPCGECNQLAISNLSQRAQLPTGCHTEVSRDVGNPNKSPGRERKLMSKAERQRQVVSFAQKQLLIELETLDSNEHESMREAAEATFAVLDNLEVDYKQFSEHVLEFVNFASSVAEMDESMENSVSLEEYSKRFEEEKVRFAHIQDECFKTEALLEVSNQHGQSLREEISHLQAILHEKQSQLKSCELETLNVETHLGDIKRSMLEADKTLKVTAEEAEVAKKLIEERKAKQMAANTALEKAKLELEN